MPVLQDIRFGLRILVKSPRFTLAAALALALGIGVNSMAFTVYNAALFKSLPFENPAQIVHIHSRNLREGWERGLDYDHYLEVRRQARAFTGLAAYMRSGDTVTDERGTPQHIPGEIVAPNTFSLLGQRPLLGRGFRDGDDQPGAERVVILSHGFWQTRFGGDAGVVGQPMTLGGAAHVVVGVMPRGMEFPFRSRFWTPIIDTPENRRSFDHRWFAFDVIGRLRDGVTVDQAQTELTELFRRIEPRSRLGTEPVVLPYVEWDVKPRHRQLGHALIGAVSFVLLIACANVANLLMARAVARGREIAIRISLGAGRGQIVRQLLVESLLLALLGGAAGWLLAAALIKWFVLEVEPFVPYWVDWSMDATSFLYLLAISVLSGVLFGLAPALQVAKTDAVKGLRESGRQASAGGRSRSLTGALVVVEISLTIVLMVGAGLFVRSLMTLDQVNVGFRTQNLLTMTVPLDQRKYSRPGDTTALVGRFTERLESVREIDAFTFASTIPGAGSNRKYLNLSDRDLADGDGVYPLIAAVTVVPGYFEALGLTMARGREFSRTDGGEDARAVIVNQRFASQYWPGGDPIGKRIRLAKSGPWSTVVGVSPTIRQTSLHRDVEALVYEPPGQAWPFWFSLIARVRSTPEAAAGALREAASGADADLTLLNLQTYDEFLDRAALETRLLSAMFSIFAAIGIALSAFGIYAVTAYATSRRTQEIGVRIALGATSAGVVRLILQSGVRQLAVALPLGLAGAVAVSRVLAGALFEISPLDGPTFLSIPVLLIVIVVAASVVPAWRAARLNPLDALRE